MKVSTSARRQDGSKTMAVTFDGAVRKSSRSQTTLRNRREHCSLDPQRLASIGLVIGSQMRVRRSSEDVALYTVSETRQESIDTTLRMALTARRRLHTEDEFDATIDTQVPNPTLSDYEAQAQSEFVERIDDDGCQQGLVALAPHGGAIERHTDSQAERVASLLGAGRASAWWCKGFRTGGGALDAWHITASEISDTSFPLLRTIASRGFAHAVAFHGFDEPGEGVLVGGAAPLTLKQEIATALECALAGSGIPVRIAGPSDGFDGDNPNNIVNRLTARGANGVQIEQSLEARNGFSMAIADAVASVYRERLSRAG